jgi:ABC-type branched-subunit amino acid transport system substrate-binding protein
MLSSCEGEAPAATPSTRSTTAVATTPTPGPTLTTTSTPSPTSAPLDELEVAYLYDAELDGAEATATAPYQAAELAFDGAADDPALAAPPRLVAFDVRGGDPDRLDEIADAIAEDPRFVAALVAPRIVGQAELVSRLEVPVVSLASRDGVTARAPGSWIRLVPPLEVLGDAAGTWVADDVRDDPLCVSPGEDGSRFAADAAAAADATDVEPSMPPAEVSAATCGAVVWTGDTDDAVTLVTALGRPRPAVVGGPALRDPRFVRDAGPAANGTLAVCGCADVSTSLSLPAQRFVQVFQSEYGLPPGPGAVESWDAAHLLVRSLDGVTTPQGLSESLAEVRRFDGLGGEYAIGGDGELANPQAHVYRYRVEGGRWVSAADADAEASGKAA